MEESKKKVTTIEKGREAKVGLEVLGYTTERRMVAGTIRAVRAEKVDEEGAVLEAAACDLAVATVAVRGRVIEHGCRVVTVPAERLIALEDLGAELAAPPPSREPLELVVPAEEPKAPTASSPSTPPAAAETEPTKFPEE